MEVAEQKSNLEILKRSESRVVFKLRDAYTRAKRVAKQIGVTRVAEIGRFVDSGIFVCQSTRPDLLYHYTTGLNTGSQGKGYTFEQAYISSVMESAEAFCGEPRQPRLIRGAHSQLRTYHGIAPLDSFHAENSKGGVRDTEPLMWTPALHLGTGREVLVPAELVYFFLLPDFYNCREAFSRTSGGLGAGFDLASATRKAMLERLEDHYLGHFELLDVKVQGLIPEGPIERLLRCHNSDFLDQFDILFYVISIPGFHQNIPFVVCYMGDGSRFYTGYGFGLDPLKAVESAHLEAFQSWVTNLSGAREDLAVQPPKPDRRRQEKFDAVWPDSQKLKPSVFLKQYDGIKKLLAKFNHDEVAVLERILSSNGYDDVYLVNLSREGVDCAVVRALIPKLWNMDGRFRRPLKANQLSFSKVMERRFLYVRGHS